MKQVLVTTSWDDGHLLDIRLAELLKKYDLQGTFYISPQDREFAASKLLKTSQIKKLSRSFEIGAHTMTHPRLSKISDELAYREILDSKQHLERIIDSKVICFCYPGGNYRKRHLAIVRKAGLKYARTVRRHSFDLKGSLLEANTSVNTYNHFQDLWMIARLAKFNPIKTFRFFQWDELAKAMFDQVLERGGVYHLWGHSWEIDNHQDWQKLEEVFKYIAYRKGVRYVTNGELIHYQPKKILIAAPYFPPHLGGQEYYAFNIAQQLHQKYGWEVTVATSGDRGMHVAKTKYESITVYRLPYLFKLSNTPFHPLWAFWLHKIIKQEDIHIINAHAPVPVFADVVVRVSKHIPTIVTYHMLSMKKGKASTDWVIGFYERHVLPKTLHGADSIICTSDNVHDIFFKQFPKKVHTITPGVDCAFYVPPGKYPKDTILFVGSLNRSDSHKGLNYLLEALGDVVKGHPKVKLIVVGGGTGIKDFEKLAKKLNIAKHVVFLGAQSGSELKAAYQNATLFSLPSLNDNFPLVILEAMASGLPVIGTAVGSIPSIVEDGKTGYIVAPANSKVLASKVNYLLNHREVAKALGLNGRHKVEKSLTWNIQAKKTDKLLRERII
jgi:glycosyltransferase involved in cell wall biosynthesis/peptidoglycan/xylan/chitin deacetylase (PgdA/CDA1 family)